MEIFYIITSFIFGTILGSFFNTLAIRYARDMFREDPVKALFSRSKCPHCDSKLKPRYMVPVLSYLFLKGRCGHCGKNISPEYPAAEMLFGLTLSLFVWRLGLSPVSLSMFISISVGIVISIIDIRTMKIPLVFVALFIIFSIYPVINGHEITDNLYGLLLMFLIFLVILLLFPGSFGRGDLFYAAAIGFLFGLELSIVVLEVSLISGSLFGIIYGLVTRKGLRIKIPFGPFLTLGAGVTALFGRDILLVYYRIIL